MSEPLHTSFKCACEQPQLGIVDGDTDAVYCAVCSGVVGQVEDITIRKGGDMEDIPPDVYEEALLSGFSDERLMSEVERREYERELEHEARFRQWETDLDLATAKLERAISHYGHNVSVADWPWFCSDCQKYLSDKGE